MENKLNFVFWGTPDVASETLEILKEAQYMPSLIVTSPDRAQGRKMLVTPPPAKVWAMENNIPFIQPEKLGQKDFEDNYDLFIVAAYGKIIPEKILHMPKLGSINIHYSLLPKYRGASPVESAILNGDTETGVTIQKMEYKMDTGPVIAVEKTQISPDEKAPELRKRLIQQGGELLVKTLSKLLSGEIKETIQNEAEATYSTKIKKEDGLIDLSDDPTKNYNKFRAYATWPRTFFFNPPTGGGKRIIITKAKLENGKFMIEKIIPENGKESDYRD
ncbi:MAG TPA: methionyl-tRNA formyltransferase [Candidatus Paceibacterota bacterium]|jgi:methionyl-tRNA formyltransferase|nr:methionyl-tRNA formyltransferase [Candidatus Paceibacterota bacterium]